MSRSSLHLPSPLLCPNLLQLDRLERFPVIGVLVKLPVVQSLLVGVLPGLALRIFVMLLPVILYALDRRAGAKGDAELDGSVATHFFSLQVRRWRGV